MLARGCTLSMHEIRAHMERASTGLFDERLCDTQLGDSNADYPLQLYIVPGDDTKLQTCITIPVVPMHAPIRPPNFEWQI